MRKQIIEMLEDDIVILFDTLNNLNKMNARGVDADNSAFLRRSKKEMIQETKDEINRTIAFKEKYQSTLTNT